MICPSCQTSNPNGARFCLNCGNRLLEVRPVEGERKYATVLFADVVGSTSLAERLDPEEWADVMNGAFGFMTAAVRRYDGTVARLMGDAVLALFGAPRAHEDDAERAVRAALDLRDAARAYAEVVRASHGLEFRVRVGINSGLTVLTNVGDEITTEYTAMGDTANVAARLQSLAEPDTVLIGGDTYHHVRALFEVEERGPVAVKGREAPVEVFRVVAASAQPDRARGVEGLSSPLVGRGEEFVLLKRALAELADGRGTFVALTGEAGVGKSRLTAELRGVAASGEVRWLEGRALSYAQTVAYFPWRQVVLASIGARESDPPENVREKLAREAGGNLLRPEGDVPFLESVLAIESRASQLVLEEVEGDELGARIAQAVLGYLGSLSRMLPTVVVLDDLHWADPASLEVMVGLASMVAQHPLLVLAASRPDKAAPSRSALDRAARAGGERAHRLRLEPLDADESRALLTNLLDVRGLPDAVRELILSRSEGNPFFLEEVLRSLIDSGHLVRRGGAWRASEDIARVDIPDTLIGVLSARIDRLPDPARRVAQTAAVIGRSFAQRVLGTVCEEEPPPERIADVAPHLATLENEELVRERSRVPEPEYIFKHGLTQEAAYERLLLRRRRELHRRTGEVLERLYGERREERAELLAHHFVRGEAWLPAARYAAVAGRRARKLYLLEEAMAHFETALESLDRAGDAPPADVIDVILGWADAATLRRIHERQDLRPAMLERLERAVRLARELQDRRRLAQSLVAQGNVMSLSGFPVQGFQPLMEALELAKELGEERLMLLPYFAMTDTLVDQDPARAAQQLEHVVALAHDARNHGIEAHALASLGLALARLGEAERAREATERALALAPAGNSVVKEGDVHSAAAMTYYDLGEPELGLQHAVTGTRMALSVGGLECACYGLMATGLGREATKRLAEAPEAYREALRIGSGTLMDPMLDRVRGMLAAVEFRAGDRSALDALERALEGTRAIHDDHGAAYLLVELARADVALGRPEAAEPRVLEALEIYRGMGTRPYIASTLDVLADVRAARGRPDAAAEARAEAEGLRRQLQREAGAGSGEDDVPAPAVPEAPGRATFEPDAGAPGATRKLDEP